MAGRIIWAKIIRPWLEDQIRETGCDRIEQRKWSFVIKNRGRISFLMQNIKNIY